jgi:hypothetical protein
LWAALPAVSSAVPDKKPARHNVRTTLNYYKDPEDGTPPAPFHVAYDTNTPDTLTSRPSDLFAVPSISKSLEQQRGLRLTTSVEVGVTDISGNEDTHTLDSHGFQIVRPESKEKTFLDDESIKSTYYSKMEQLLKEV